MNCRKFNQGIVEYYDHQWPDERRKEFESHRTACATCRKTLEDWAEISAMAKSLPAVKAPENFEAMVRRRIQEAGRASKGWNSIGRWMAIPKLQFAALGAMVIALIAVLLWQPKPTLDAERNPPPIAQQKAPQVLEPADGPEYVDVLLKGAGNEQVIMRLPSTIRVESPDYDESYFQNVSY